MNEDDDYERCLRNRTAINYRSTRLWNPNPHVLGMIGERALARYFGVPQDLRDKPYGDKGVDLQLNLRDYDWITLDAKASPYGDWLRSPKGEVVDKTIYVLVHATEDPEKRKCCGWLWGLTLRFTPALAWFRGDIVCHRWPTRQLRDMALLKEWMTDWRHQEVDR